MINHVKITVRETQYILYTNIVNVRFVYLRKYTALLLFPLHFHISQSVFGYASVDCMSYNIGQSVCVCVRAIHYCV